MNKFIKENPKLSLLIFFIALILIWAIFAQWPDWLKYLLGKKKVFVITIFNGITLGALYFLVASGFTLIFGLMKNVNLAHGSLYMLGGYVGYEIADATGWWMLSFLIAFIAIALVGVLLQYFFFRKMEGDDLKQTLVTIGISIVLADIMLWIWGGGFYQIIAPDWLSGPVQLPIITAVKSSGKIVFLKYPIVRLAILIAAIVIGILMWLALNKTKIGMLVRAGVDDTEMLSATGTRVQRIFVLIFAFGAGLAGFAGVVGGTFQSIAPGEDIRILLASLVVVIVGGMGSIPGAAIGAVLIGLAEQLGSAYFPTYSVVLTFLIMVLVLAFKPDGIISNKRQ